MDLYKDAGRRSEPARCRRCGHAFTSRRHVEDLIDVERELGYRYDLGDGADGDGKGHYQWVCPPCRRASFALAQGLLWRGRRGGGSLPRDGEPMPMPVHANPGLGEGPLGIEDEENFHP